MEDKFQDETEERHYSKLQSFFIIVVIPSIFAVAVALIVATVAGVNVIDKAKEYREKIPFLPSQEEQIVEKQKQDLEEQIKELELEIKIRDDSIAQLKSRLDSKDKEIEKLQLEKKQLEREIETLLSLEQKTQQEFREIIKTYETMSAKKAAPIIVQMNEQDALEILSHLKSDTLAAIMERMNAADAARFTSLLKQKSQE